MLPRVPELVWIPPHAGEIGIWAEHVAIHFERALLSPDFEPSTEVSDFQQGLVTIPIQAPPRPGAIYLVERFALSLRLATWIVSDRFLTYGAKYRETLAEWFRAQGLSERALDALGWCNALPPDAVLVDPTALTGPVLHMAEQDVWTSRKQFQATEWAYEHGKEVG